MSTAGTLAVIVLAAYGIAALLGAALDVHPTRDRPLGYLLFTTVLEVAMIWLAINVLVNHA